MSQDTSEVSERHRFDEAACARFLEQELSGYQGNLSVKKFGFGQSNPTYFLSTDRGQEYVLRKKPAGKLVKGAHAVDREYRVMKAVGLAGFEVPQVHVLCEDDSVLGTSFYVMD